MSEHHNNNQSICSCTIIHEDVINNVREQLPSSEAILELADFFKILADSTRIRILSALSHAEMCVCDISALLNMTQSAVSHQLRLLKQSRLVKNRKNGKIVYYSLDDKHIKDVLSVGFDHLGEIK
ncbi:MAG: winged helix-turn-helix transcriptional regulator [Fibrobacter sp.]|jgi:DNA-binding transcriptional ArsR family regulator|nr:winged helix-turn-helix transcriptional regulator [Fibrobacter sp.]